MQHNTYILLNIMEEIKEKTNILISLLRLSLQ